MYESFEPIPEYFIFPDITKERGEFERVADTFGVDSETLVFLASEEGRLRDLSNEIWEKLDNTDSNKYEKDNWEAVREFSEMCGRDWLDLKKKIEKGNRIDAPIIMKYGELYHLVSGNTRLMVARALGIIPKVLVFEYIHDRTREE